MSAFRFVCRAVALRCRSIKDGEDEAPAEPLPEQTPTPSGSAGASPSQELRHQMTMRNSTIADVIHARSRPPACQIQQYGPFCVLIRSLVIGNTQAVYTLEFEALSGGK